MALLAYKSHDYNQGDVKFGLLKYTSSALVGCKLFDTIFDGVEYYKTGDTISLVHATGHGLATYALWSGHNQALIGSTIAMNNGYVIL